MKYILLFTISLVLFQSCENCENQNSEIQALERLLSDVDYKSGQKDTIINLLNKDKADLYNENQLLEESNTVLTNDLRSAVSKIESLKSSLNYYKLMNLTLSDSINLKDVKILSLNELLAETQIELTQSQTFVNDIFNAYYLAPKEIVGEAYLQSVSQYNETVETITQLEAVGAHKCGIGEYDNLNETRTKSKTEKEQIERLFEIQN